MENETVKDFSIDPGFDRDKYISTLRHDFNRLWGGIQSQMENFSDYSQAREATVLAEARNKIQKLRDFLPVYLDELGRINVVGPDNFFDLEGKLDTWEKEIDKYELEIKDS